LIAQVPEKVQLADESNALELSQLLEMISPDRQGHQGVRGAKFFQDFVFMVCFAIWGLHGRWPTEFPCHDGVNGSLILLFNIFIIYFLKHLNFFRFRNEFKKLQVNSALLKAWCRFVF